MFPFTRLPEQWEKRLVRYLLQRLDLLEDLTLDDLSNIEGSVGTNSVITLKNVGIKVERLRVLIKIPKRFKLKQAVIGTLSVKLPANLLLSGAAEILINDVRVVAELASTSNHSRSSTPSTPKPGASQIPIPDDAFPTEEFPATAEDLAQSFLDSQSRVEKEQLMSLYVEDPMTSSTISNSTTTTDDDEEETGVGAAIGLPGILASIFKGIADRMIVRVRGATASLETTLSEERGGEKVLLEIEVDDVDIEGVSKNVTAASNDGTEKPRREGKRRITVENIRGHITASASMFGVDNSQAESAMFGGASETTQREIEVPGSPIDDMSASTSTIRHPPSPKFSPTLNPRFSPRSTPVSPSVVPKAPSEPYEPSNQNERIEDLAGSFSSDGDRYLDYDDSDEEELAFAPPSLRTSTRPGFNRHFNPQYDGGESGDESEDDVDGGARFGQAIPRVQSLRSPSQSFLSTASSTAASAMFKSTASGLFEESSSMHLRTPSLKPRWSNISDDSSGDDMDAEASRLLSESTIFSREEADSLYMSATSGMLRSRSELNLHKELDQKDEENGEIDAEEMDQHLDKLINGSPVFSAPGSPEFKRPTSPRPQRPRKIRKECLNLDNITIYFPSLSAGTIVVEQTNIQVPEKKVSYSSEIDDQHHQMPGAFSMYASRHSGKFPSPESPPSAAAPVHQRSLPRVKIMDAMDVRPTAPSLDQLLGEGSSGKKADIEIIAANLKGTVDIETEKMIGWVIETVQDAISDDTPESPRKSKQPQVFEESEQKKSIQFIAEEVDVRLIHHLRGWCLDTLEEDEGDDRIQLQCQLSDVKIHRKGLPENASTSKLSVKKFALRDQEEGIITFLPTHLAPLPNSSTSAAKMTHSTHHRKRSSASAPAGGLLGHDPREEDDIVVIFSQSSKKTRINVQTLPLKIRGDLKRLEETFSAFGGVGSVLASTTASTATITRAGNPPSIHNIENEAENAMDTKLEARIGGLILDVVGETATINMSTSPLKVQFQTGKGVAIGIDKIEIAGPSPGEKAARIVIDGSRIEFASRPTQEDLGKLLERLTPSKDRYADDDILIDTLLRQREAGSVLRMHIAGVRGEIIDMTIFDRLKELGNEVIQVLTVTDFVAGDERPGLLTLINIDAVFAYAEIGGVIGKMEAEMESVGLAQVSAPTLFAVVVGTISVRRSDDELLGEGLERHMFSTADKERPMIMMRMVGDEPEPIIKFKLWNIRVEYNVETLISLMQAPSNATGDVLAHEMVESIINLPPKENIGERTTLGFDIEIKDSIVALNPLDLKSRALVVFSDARFQAALPVGGTVSAAVGINKASLMLIDNTENLQSAERGQTRGRRDILSEHLSGFASMGYVPMVTISSARVQLIVIGDAVELIISDDLLLIESCADSTATMMALFNGLKPPGTEEQQIKYCTETIPIDLLRSLNEDEFTADNRNKVQSLDDEEDLLYQQEDVPTNFTFVDSFYGHRSPPETPREDLADSMLEDDLSQIRSQASLSRQSSGGDSVFREKVTMLDDEPLEFIENHFKPLDSKQKGKRALNQDATEKVSRFPLRLRLRDVHIIWNLHDGYDWQRTRETISNAVRKVEAKAAERRNRRVSFDIDDDDESVVDDYLFNSIYIGISANRDPKDLTNDINKAMFDDHMSETSYATSTAESSRPQSSRSRSTVNDYHHPHRDSRGGGRNRLKLGRSKQHKLQIEIKGVNAEVLVFPPDNGEVQSSVDLRLNNLEIFDNVPTSTWRKFVTYNRDFGERESSSDMVRIEIMVVKPVPHLAATELVIKANILPLRLHVDQDALDFLTRFFEFKDDSTNLPPPNAPQPEPPFLQRVEVNSVHVKLDYKPKKVDYVGLRSGHTTEFMNFFILEEAEMTLRHIILHGVSGFPRMSKMLNDTWMPDIQRTQLGGVLAGVAPVRSLVNLGKGARDLIVVPVREYRKDGRVVRSIQKGVGGFVRNTAGELVRLGTKMAVGTQGWLQSAEVAFGGGPGQREPMYVRFGDDDFVDEAADTPERAVSMYADQPETIGQGVRAASRSLKRNFGEAKQAVMAIPSEMAERGDAQGAAIAIARAAPIAVLRPMLGVSDAVAQTLMGVGNAMEPNRRRQREDKYKKGH